MVKHGMGEHLLIDGHGVNGILDNRGELTAEGEIADKPHERKVRLKSRSQRYMTNRTYKRLPDDD